MKPLNSDSYKLLGSILAAILMIGVLTYQVVTQGALMQWNLPVYYLMRKLRSSELEPIFVQISLFNSLVMSCFWAVVSLYFIIRKDIWRATHWILLGLLVGAMTLGLKHSTGIARPGAVFRIKDAFPSAHVSANMTLLGGIILLLDLNNQVMGLWSRWLIYTSYGTWVYLIALSRLYLAAHWLTDILGGIFISCISLGLFSLAYHRKLQQPPIRIELMLVSLGSLATFWLMRFILEYDKVLKFYLASF